MNRDLKFPQWQESLRDALLEFNPERLRLKLQKAEEAIAKRLRQLSIEQANPEEIRALNDGRYLIGDVKQDRLSPGSS
jgi:hypothetical protein